MPSSVDATLPEQRIVEAAAVLPSFGAVTGWAGLRWVGGVWFGGRTAGGSLSRPVTLATGGHDVRSQPGLLVSHERLHPGEIEVVDGVAVTSALRSLCFEMRYSSSVWAAVAALDLAAYSDLVAVAEFATYVAVMTGWTGIPRVRAALVLGDENSWSPRETWLRLVWVLLAGLPRPLTNVPVFDTSGRHLGTPDLLDPEAGLVGEYDGSLHLHGAQRHRDVVRLDTFRAAGLECVTVMSGDTDAVAADRILRAYARARRTPDADRAWTLHQPSWWVSTSTVEQRRHLSDGERSRWLRLRQRTA